MQPSRDGRRSAVRRDGRVPASQLADLPAVLRAAATCDLCRLCHDRTVVVTGRGPADADVVVVGEAPTYREDRTGELLVGDVGELFDELLGLAGLTRDELYVTSVVKCRPPTGRTPFPDEIEACEGWLFREIALVQPRVIVTLGALALRLVTGREQRLVEVRGQVQHAQLQGRDVLVWPLLHPAAAAQVPRLGETLRADARALGALLRGARADAQRASEIVVEPSAPAGVAHDQAVDDGEPQLAFDVG